MQLGVVMREQKVTGIIKSWVYLTRILMGTEWEYESGLNKLVKWG